jgi:sulfate transport system ATP-binding protein
VPYGQPGIMLEVQRSAEQSTSFPLQTGQQAWVGIRRLHVLSHPGMNFLLITDGSLRSQSAITLGGYLARMAHARLALLGIGQDKEKMDQHLQESRKQLGSGMASLESKAVTLPFKDALPQAVEGKMVDMVILGWRPTAGMAQLQLVLRSGDHHLLLATEPVNRIRKALICLASGEPGKDTVVFAGRLLRHLGASATLITVVSKAEKDDPSKDRIVRFLSAGQNSLARFGVQGITTVRKGDLISIIQEEVKTGGYDLVVLGASLPDASGGLGLDGMMRRILNTIEGCSFLIVQSRQYRRMKSKLWRRT